ncbi:uncharacterized protein THITE_2116441 [Thermothielavioides terrestris NRRL 8126]|uniref:Uncharacterized protein n=1 Tax=Thermothielavioides terrestris (strain ATCC 38088 / NRRL 8126) TaxID=578455 RepID=G2R5V8_THETT|nr:uncharacterized protein THITE_2116441 [Thermothielavioides terrestris NRRL 8126]AEO67547.1 hypothetical protein THITE_2116441 [Thermothielavioides terrestris NRRL 8126]
MESIGGIISGPDVVDAARELPKSTKHIQNLLRFSIERDVVLQPNPKKKGGYRSINWKRPTNIEALLMHVTGVEPEVECNYCNKNQGPFMNCIVSRDNTGNGACAACHYNSGSNRCSFFLGEQS